jgi:YD repeat-containing protein
MDLSLETVYPTIKDTQSPTPNTIVYKPSEQSVYDTLGLIGVTVNPNQAGQLGWFEAGEIAVSPETQTFVDATVQTSYGCTGKTDYGPTAGNYLTTAVGFPDTSNLYLGWEKNGNNYTGRIGSITLRGGGAINFNWNPNNATHGGLNCTYLVPTSMTRTTADGTRTYITSFSTSAPYVETVTKIDEGGNHTQYTFTGFSANGASGLQALTQVQNNQDASTLLSTDVYCYNAASGQPGNCATAVVSEPVTEIDVYHTIPNLAAGSSRTQTQYDGGPTGSCATGHGGCYGNVTYSAQYDFGATSPTRTTTITYGSCSAGCTGSSATISPIGSNVNNKPGDVVTTLNGSTVAESRYTYDAYGNLKTTYQWTGSAWLSNPKVNIYNPNGTIATAYDLAGNATTYQYNSSNYKSCGACNNYPFPTSMTAGGLTTSATYDGYGGVKLTHVDPNPSGNTTIYGYTDPWNRVNSIQDPLGNTVNLGYSVTSLTSDFTFGSSVNNVTTTLDGYGRKINTQKQQGPSSSNYDTVSTSYTFGGTNNDKRLISTNIPCTANLNATCGYTNQIFIDVLGRTTWTSTPATTEYVQTIYTQNDVLSNLGPASPGENLKSVQKEYDGLGRLKSVCGIMTTGGYSTCSQNSGSYSGVFTTYSYASAAGSTTVKATRGVQSRSKTYDGLGRVTSSTTPEGGTNIYVYDVAGCYNVNYPGHLTAAGAANGNGYCYAYDTLGRMTLAYGLAPSGAKLCRKFFYDNSTGATGTIPSGVTVNYPYGHLVEAETDNCGSPVTPITDEWFSYDKDGNQTDIWELTPHSGQYYHSTATFAGNGAVTSLQLASPSLYTINYTLDGEGRWNTLAQGSSNIVTGHKDVITRAVYKCLHGRGKSGRAVGDRLPRFSHPVITR